MTPTELRKQIVALRTKLEKDLDKTSTHFGQHMVYIVAYDDLEELTRQAAKSLHKEEL